MEKILVLDFGGQYNQLIARRIREHNVYSEIKPFDRISKSEIIREAYKGIVFTGGPNSVYDPGAPSFDHSILDLGIPVLGICYGAQFMAYAAGGKVIRATDGGEYGKAVLKAEDPVLFAGVPAESLCWMSHMDRIEEPPPGFKIIGYTDNCSCAAFADEKRRLYGVQFHPEVTHTEYGEIVLKNFLYKVCGCSGDWVIADYTQKTIEKYKTELADKRILLALSGGVDSSVTAALLSRAVGSNLTCVFVDHGLLRKGEADSVERIFRDRYDLNFIRVNAGERFLSRLAGVTDPERKRKIIGEEFIRVFEEEAKKLGHTDILAQGTIYPDVIESGRGDSAVIKSHHNVGGLPDSVSFERIVEPLNELFKDEVRKMGKSLGLPDELVYRQPFPGPGLAVRIIGEVTLEKTAILGDADMIFRQEIAKAGNENLPDQYFAVLTDMRSVGVMGDARTYGYVLALRAVSTDDFMTAEWTRLPYDVLAEASTRITNEVPGIGRVVYDISSKPPATVEWE